MTLTRRRLLAALAALPAAPALSQQRNWRRYVVQRFGTRIDYPADVFTPRPAPQNGDGRVFDSYDGRAHFLVYGYNNALGHSLGTLRESDKTLYDEVTYETGGDTWYVVTGFIGDRVGYHRKLLRGGVVHAFEISYPASAKPTYDSITGRMSRSFGAG
jgi:hypothetical protein